MRTIDSLDDSAVSPQAEAAKPATPFTALLWCYRLHIRSWAVGIPRPRAAPSDERLPHELEDCASVLSDHSHPCQRPHLREIDSAKTETRDQDVYAITQRLVIKRVNSLCYFLRAVRTSPPVLNLCMSLWDGHLQWCVGHLEWYE